jgi:hypothetical protein
VRLLDLLNRSLGHLVSFPNAARTAGKVTDNRNSADAQKHY